MCKCPFKVGDIVKVTKEGLMFKALVPADLVSNGYKNLFHVIQVKEHSKYPECYPQGTISLVECCNKTGFICTAHPAQWFEKVKEKEET